MDVDNSLEKLTSLIIQCIIKVHAALGSGFNEVIYRRALIIELKNNNIPVETEKSFKIYYENIHIGTHRLDLVIDSKVIIELKAVETLAAAHYLQLKSYMKTADINTGLLVNFSGDKADFRRINRK